MFHDTSKILYQAAQDSQQKFEYFFTGAIGAMFAYTAQTYTPKKLDLSPSTLEPLAIICFAIAFFLGLRRLDCLYHILGISSEEAHARGNAQETKKAIRMIEANPFECQPKPSITLEQMRKDYEWNIKRAESAKPLLDNLQAKVGSFYNWRNHLMIAGFSLIVLSRILSPYFDPPILQTKETDGKVSKQQESTKKDQATQSSQNK
jgi:hypothetical protein